MLDVDKQTYLFRHQFTGVIKVYKEMTLAQAKAANGLLSRDASNCRWFPDSLTATPLFSDFPEPAAMLSADDERRYVGSAEVVDGRR